MNYLRRILHLLGPLGVTALGILLFCIAFYLSVVKPAETDLAAQRDAVQRLKKRTPYPTVWIDSRGDELRRFQNLFPTTDKIPDELQKLWVIASEYKFDLQQGEYRLESAPGLMRYRITLPVRTSYTQIRYFVSFILKEIPTVSIDGLRFERKKISETQLDAQIRLTLYFRPVTTGHAQP